MLQVAERATGTKRKALLVGTSNLEDTAPALAVEPHLAIQRQLSGVPFNRMRADPELQRVRHRLFIGIVSVAVMILLATIWNLVSVWNKSLESAPDVVAEPSVESPPPTYENQPQSYRSANGTLDFEQIVKRRQAELSDTGGLGAE